MGGPYASTAAAVGGIPTTKLDVPILAVFILLFLIGFASHITLLRRNLARNHRFIFSGMIGGFCMSRVVTCIMRIVWATRPHNVRVAIAANVFASAGILLIYIVNLIFALRMLRAACPSMKLAKVLDKLAIAFPVFIVLELASLITTLIQSVYTLNGNTRRIDRDIQLAASTFFLFIAFLPVLVVIIATVLRNEVTHRPFGSGTWSAKVARLLTTSLLATVIAGFRAGTAWETPRPATNPAWFDAKWCFYVFNFTIEITIVYILLFSRVDKHFHITPPTVLDEEKTEHALWYAVGADGSWQPVAEIESSRFRRLECQRFGTGMVSTDTLESTDSKK